MIFKIINNIINFWQHNSFVKKQKTLYKENKIRRKKNKQEQKRNEYFLLNDLDIIIIL